jgi:hypothetical protein
VLDIVATTFVGALGGEVVTDDDALDGSDVPLEFVAVTVNVYEVPDDNPDTIIDVDDDIPVPVKSPGLLVAV